jgi:hypothetical protein
MFRPMQRLYETEETVSGDGVCPIIVSGKSPNKRYYIYINRILLGVAGLNITITDPHYNTIDKFVERYWTDKVFTIDKHFVNEIVVVSDSDNAGNLIIGLVEYSSRTDSADISPKSFTIALYGDIRE